MLPARRGMAAGEEVLHHTTSTIAYTRSSSTAVGRCAEAGGSHAGGGDAQGFVAALAIAGCAGIGGSWSSSGSFARSQAGGGGGWRRSGESHVGGSYADGSHPTAGPELQRRPADPVLRQEGGGWRERGRTPMRWKEGRREGGTVAAVFFLREESNFWGGGE
jgi:hypothetical protein